MNHKKGPLRQVVDAVGDAVQAVAVEIGLGEPEPVMTPTPKSVRKSARKTALAKVEEARQAVRKARVAAHSP